MSVNFVVPASFRLASAESNEINWGSAEFFKYSTAVNTTFTFTNLPQAKTILLLVENTSTTFNRTMTFPGTIRWQAGSAEGLVFADTATLFTFSKVGTDIIGAASRDY